MTMAYIHKKILKLKSILYYEETPHSLSFGNNHKYDICLWPINH
jgi:hypothetical protein